ncbi:hypothetical protein C9374_007037 [Naegleria lovaniensis]|uniref:F-box domain-containing protein n=1 Tax=Naegleria lovaniensis TaxID=51637 RepID=A0AA88H6E3_NAELO|nr:uncharacterized protein C9374_007037 [Naegleria lovaniensis]KAG2393506.1 hypothetical protein C9374_007037 [Naegleria lovaniensis]
MTRNGVHNNLLERLPSEMKTHILSFLPIPDIARGAGLVDKSWFELVSPSLTDEIVSNTCSSKNKNEIHNNDYTVDIWKFMITQFKEKLGPLLKQETKQAPKKRNKSNANNTIVKDNDDIAFQNFTNLSECKQLMLKWMIRSRKCRSCGKGVQSLQELLTRKIVSTCNCPGYICRDRCFFNERMANESIKSCSKCGYNYVLKPSNKHNSVSTKIFKNYPVTSQLILTTISSLSVILFIYSIISGFGYVMPSNEFSDIWIYLEDVWIFKHLFLWKYFVNGMSYICLIGYLILVVASLVSMDFSSISQGDEGAAEILGIILTMVAVVAIPYLFHKFSKKHVTKKAILGSPVVFSNPVSRTENTQEQEETIGD